MNNGRREKQAAAKQAEKMIKVRINMTSKERAELKTQAMKLDSIFQIGKASLTPRRRPPPARRRGSWRRYSRGWPAPWASCRP